MFRTTFTVRRAQFRGSRAQRLLLYCVFLFGINMLSITKIWERQIYMSTDRSDILEPLLSTTEFSQFVSFVDRIFSPSSLSKELIYAYHNVLEEHAINGSIVVMGFVDNAAIPTAVNFWRTYQRLDPTNKFLFLSTGREVCDKLRHDGISRCFVFFETGHGSDESLYLSTDVKKLLNIKTLAICMGLLLGYDVLMTDIDMVWFENPLYDLQTYKDIDMAALWDCESVNAGFVFVKPSTRTLRLYQEILQTAVSTGQCDQVSLNRVLWYNIEYGLRFLSLPDDKYVCGKRYWEDENRNFPEDTSCPRCIVVHNNWMVGLHAKTYRLKEMLLWNYDGDSYYSNPERKYLTFKIRPKTRIGEEIRQFGKALNIGRILNRTVIIPRFRCGGVRENCTLLHHINIRVLERTLPESFREASFLDHHLVPDSVKGSRIAAPVDDMSDNQRKLNTRACTVRGSDLLTRYGNIRASILDFNYLEIKVCSRGEKLIESALVPATYRQYVD